MNEFTFTKTGFHEYVEWQTENKKTLKRINDLLEDIRRNGLLQGKGEAVTLEIWGRIFETHRRLQSSRLYIGRIGKYQNHIL
jgi:toxin YoeB